MALFVLPDKKFNGFISGRKFVNGVTEEDVPESQVELVARILCRYHGATVEGTPTEKALAAIHIPVVEEKEEVKPAPAGKAAETKDQKAPADEKKAPSQSASL